MYIPQSVVDKFWVNVGNVFVFYLFVILGLIFILIFIYASVNVINAIQGVFSNCCCFVYNSRRCIFDADI